MKKNYTDIILLVDNSGSMSQLKSGVIEGINEFITNQQQCCVGTATLSLMFFNSHYTEVYIAKNIHDVELLTKETYCTSGMTAMLDAIAHAIVTTGQRYSEMPEDDRPDKVMFIIQTDGEENSSIEYDANYGGHAKINALITEQTDKYSWEFTFMGANINAKQTAATIGIAAHNAMKFANSGDGAKGAFRSVSSNLYSCRVGEKMDMSYMEDDYNTQSVLGTTQD